MKSNLVVHAEHELQLLRAADPARLGSASDDAILAVVEAFVMGGQSAADALMAGVSLPTDIVATLLRFDPLIPLSGQASEWAVLDQSDEVFAVNKRCPHVFKRRDGTAYDRLGTKAPEPAGGVQIGRVRKPVVSARDIAFPYLPKIEVSSN